MATSSRATAKDADPKGLYSTLGVAVAADVSEIRKSYRRLALRWHPDKNPDDPSATEQFQQISSAYEVLSDSTKRHMYDTTGCIDEEELAEGHSGDMAADIFAAFFGGGMHEDLDEEEQVMMDEFLRMCGSNPFRSGRRRRGKKGRGGGLGRKGRASARGADGDGLEEAFLMAMGMGMGLGMEAEPVCPEGHSLKRRKATEEYACDVCEKDIVVGKRFYDCRKCDWCMCVKCHKEAKAAAADDSDDGIDCLDPEEELMQTFCEMNVTPVRKGNRLVHQCDICKACFSSAEKVLPHMEEMHSNLIEEFVMEAAGLPQSGLAGGDPMMELLGGLMGGMPGMQGMPGQGSSGTKKSGSRKKR